MVVRPDIRQDAIALAVVHKTPEGVFERLVALDSDLGHDDHLPVSAGGPGTQSMGPFKGLYAAGSSGWRRVDPGLGLIPYWPVP